MILNQYTYILLVVLLLLCERVASLSFSPLRPPPSSPSAPSTHCRQIHSLKQRLNILTPRAAHTFSKSQSALALLPFHLPDVVAAQTHDALSYTIPSLITSATDVLQQQQPEDAEALGHDIFTFLIVSVIIVPLCKALNITPVLGFLAVGCLLGPFGLQVFSNNEADIQLGDFGILFLLFNEGLSLSPERIKELGKFTGLGVSQLLISIGLIFVGSFWGGPFLIKYVQEIGIPLDIALIKPLFDNPVETFCISAAGALSSSAFVLPVLKEKDWEDRPEGIAGLSILLLQDLAVAPLLVLLPLLAGSGPGTSTELGVLVAKATLGFGLVLYIGSIALRYVFDIVASARSTETFVAAALLVAVGMGQAADSLGLSASTGAFAAGVLLAGNKYRAQIQADIRPFEGILLGIFFITAGADLDPAVVLKEWPVLFSGILTFIAVKAGIIFSSGPALGLTTAQAARVAFTLSGGGEFALVLFQLAQDLGILPSAVSKLLIASVVISMSLTPLLGEFGSYLGDLIETTYQEVREDGLTVEEETLIFEQIDADQSGTISLDELRNALLKLDFAYISIAEIFSRFDTNNDGVIERAEWAAGIKAGLLNDAFRANPIEALSNNDISIRKDALVICGYGEIGKSLYTVLQTVGGSGAENGGIVCFDLNPARVTTGVLSKAPVVFGDGARLELLKAVGVTNPRAIMITYTNDARRIEATERLRSSFPDNTPIYVYEGKSKITQELLDAGATDVISDTTETILRFASLVGACNTIDHGNRLRSIFMNGENLKYEGDEEEIVIPGLSEDFLIDLAEDIGCSRADITDFWLTFCSIANDRDTVPIEELKEMLMRQANDGPCDGKEFEICLSSEDEDGESDLTFIEYCRALYITCSIEY